MNKIFKIIKYIIALLPVMVALTMIFAAVILLPITLIPSLNIVAAEIIFLILLLIYGIRISKTRINKNYKLLYGIIGILTTFLFFIWSKKIFLIQPLQLLLYAGCCEGWLQDFRQYIKNNAVVFSWFNIFDCIFICFCFLVGNDKKISDGIKSSILSILESLKLSINDIDNVVIALFLICWLLIFPIIRSGLGTYFFKKQNPINLPPDRILWGAYFTGYGLSLVSITSYLGIYFNSTISETNQDIIFFTLIYSIYLSGSILFWIPVYTSLNKLGQNRDKFISNLIASVLFLAAVVLLDQIESEIINILTWFLPVLLPNFIGEIYKISEKYQQGENVTQSLKMERHLYWLTMVSFNTLLIFNVISALSGADDKKHKFKDVLIEILSCVLKSNDFTLSIVSSLIIVLFSLFLAWWLSKGIVKLLKHIYLDPSKRYFE